MSNIESLKLELKNLKAEINEMKKNDNLMRAMIDSKVSYKHFTWILSILMTIILGTFVYIANQINEIRTLSINIGSEIAQVKIDLSQVKGKLEPYEIEYQK